MSIGTSSNLGIFFNLAVGVSETIVTALGAVGRTVKQLDF